ncbi:MAG: putative nucleic-acid-binding protein [Caulobacteraceae bacterium]|nr:putative nucleic-acid-binding protein [Caulobacteraceae bacterium]
MTDTAPGPTPAAPYIKYGAQGDLHIEALRCVDCGAAALRTHAACRHCGSRKVQQAYTTPNSGTLEQWTVVSRSFPGIKVPFVSAIVRLDDGPLLKGVLREIDPDPETIKVGTKVKVVFDDANGAVDKAGNPYVCFFFEPA